MVEGYVTYHGRRKTDWSSRHMWKLFLVYSRLNDVLRGCKFFVLCCTALWTFHRASLIDIRQYQCIPYYCSHNLQSSLTKNSVAVRTAYTFVTSALHVHKLRSYVGTLLSAQFTPRDCGYVLLHAGRTNWKMWCHVSEVTYAAPRRMK